MKDSSHFVEFHIKYTSLRRSAREKGFILIVSPCPALPLVSTQYNTFTSTSCFQANLPIFLTKKNGSMLNISVNSLKWFHDRFNGVTDDLESHFE